jgi:hypothetical protein
MKKKTNTKFQFNLIFFCSAEKSFGIFKIGIKKIKATELLFYLFLCLLNENIV